MTEFNAGNIVRRGACLLRDAEHLLRGYIEELRVCLNETQDEPGTGDSIDLRMFPCDPTHGSYSVCSIRRSARYVLAPQRTDRSRRTAYTDSRKRVPRQ